MPEYCQIKSDSGQFIRDAGDVRLEENAQGFAKDGHRAGNDHHRDHGHQQAVLHGGGTGLVLEEISVLFHACLHLGTPQLLQVSMANCRFRSLFSASVSELFENALFIRWICRCSFGIDANMGHRWKKVNQDLPDICLR